MQLTVREATAADEAGVVALWRACGLVASYNDPVADFRFAKAGACSDVLVGVDAAGGVLGSVMVGHDGHRGWLYSVAVDPSQRKQGLGAALVRHAEQALGARGCLKINLQIVGGNESVSAFYASLGYAIEPRISMGKKLSQNIPKT